VEQGAQPPPVELRELDGRAAQWAEGQQEQLFRRPAPGLVAAALQPVFPLRERLPAELPESLLVSPVQRQPAASLQLAEWRVALAAAQPAAPADDPPIPFAA